MATAEEREPEARSRWKLNCNAIKRWLD
ncbi:hypothetical protein CCACVL1_04678 [Corchorus capsularis]|uniref:Uncharacterized protein n=1 Tax=Corchorus capsularis TaxID=210143 RepID=A0A1R3JQH0_COCAP|nr:hypothetical protein CCACVL1_04678 [Corchorus capsularis]